MNRYTFTAALLLPAALVTFFLAVPIAQAEGLCFAAEERTNELSGALSAAAEAAGPGVISSPTLMSCSIFANVVDTGDADFQADEMTCKSDVADDSPFAIVMAYVTLNGEKTAYPTPSGETQSNKVRWPTSPKILNNPMTYPLTAEMNVRLKNGDVITKSVTINSAEDTIALSMDADYWPVTLTNDSSAPMLVFETDGGKIRARKDGNATGWLKVPAGAQEAPGQMTIFLPTGERSKNDLTLPGPGRYVLDEQGQFMVDDRPAPVAAAAADSGDGNCAAGVARTAETDASGTESVSDVGTNASGGLKRY